jgi:hypothetical protein
MTAEEKQALLAGLDMAQAYMNEYGETDETTGEKFIDLDTLAGIVDIGAGINATGRD